MAIEADADEKMALERIGRVLGEWKLERLIGVGGMAAVYAARGKDDKVAALKVLHPEMCRRADIRQRFAQEGTAATRVGHPGVVAVLGNGEEPDGTAFLVLELLEGDTLTDAMKRAGTLPLPRLLDILDQVLDVLAAAHERGIVHRDLKPDNLFITADGKVKVLDFGIARVLDDIPGAYKTRTGITLGTVPFMSPEQALGKRAQVDGRSDIFSLGAMMFRILAGRHVHTAETDAELLVAMASQPAPPLSSVAPAVSPGLGSVVDLALAFSKDSRYPNARTMQSDLRAVQAGSAPPHASSVRSSREMATRTDMPVPAISMVAGAKGATIPEATAMTRPDLSAAPAGQRSPAGVLMTPTVPDSPSFTVADTQAPASFRGVDLPRPERADPEQAIATAATTVENPAFAATTAKMVAPPDGRTITSTPPKKRRWVLPAVIGTVALTALAGGGYVALSQSGSTDSNPSDPSAAAAPTTALPPGLAPPSDPAAAAAAAQTQQGAANPQAPGALQPARQLTPAKPGAPGAPTNAPPASPTAATNPSPTPTAPPPNPATAPPSPPPATTPPSPPPATTPPPAPPSPNPTTAPAPPSPAPPQTTAPPAPPPTPTTTTPPPSPSSKWKRDRGKNH